MTHCCWCKQEIPASLRTIEHIIELSNGGMHSVHNITMACKSCNSSRVNRNNDQSDNCSRLNKP